MVNLVDILKNFNNVNSVKRHVSQLHVMKVYVKLDFVEEGKIDMNVFSKFKYHEIFEILSYCLKYGSVKPKCKITNWFLFVKSMDMPVEEWFPTFAAVNERIPESKAEIDRFVGRLSRAEKQTLANLNLVD